MKAAGGDLAATRSPRRPGTARAYGLRARSDVHLSVPQTAPLKKDLPMFRFKPASRDVRSALLAGLVVSVVIVSYGLAFVLARGDRPTHGNTMAALPSSGPAIELLPCDRSATDPLVAAKLPASPADEPSPGKSPAAGDAKFNMVTFLVELARSEALVWKDDHFESAKKKIRVLRLEPKGGGKHPAVVMLGGQDGLGQMTAYKFATLDLLDKGHVVVFIRYYDRTGTPDNVPRPEQQEFARWIKGDAAKEEKNRAREHFDQWITTVVDAVAYARTLPTVDADRVGIVGFSLGGYLALSAAPHCTPPVGAVVEMFGGIPKEKRDKVGPLSPTLIVHGEKDDVVPVDEAYLAFGLLRARKQAVEILIQDAGHGCCYPGTENPNPFSLWEARAAMTKHFVTHLSDAAVGKRAWEARQGR
jgi:dienelactone hydrolase